jgi:Holliday junction DNA helicase RuvA
MIGKIKGTVSEIKGNMGLIETSSGIFFRCYLTPAILSAKTPGEKIEIYTYLQVREDALILFGFEDQSEHDLFTLLLTVSGIGPKTAYSIVSFTKPTLLYEAVRSNQLDYFTKIPGLGKKTAMKIILELSQKLKENFSLDKMYLSEDDKLVVDAFVSLGFKSADAKDLLSKLPKGLKLEEKIRQGLQKVGKI